jgi:hypothetical protein
MDRAGKPFFAKEQAYSVVGAPGWAPDPPAASRGSRSKRPQKRASPADAFCTKAPCPRATTQASQNFQSATGGPPAESGLYPRELFPIIVYSHPLPKALLLQIFKRLTFRNIWNNMEFHHFIRAWQEAGTMEKRDLELIQKHISSDAELKRYMDEHEEYERKLQVFNQRIYLTPEEEMERKRLQKLKLAGRDRIEAILSKYRSRKMGEG